MKKFLSCLLIFTLVINLFNFSSFATINNESTNKSTKIQIDTLNNNEKQQEDDDNNKLPDIIESDEETKDNVESSLLTTLDENNKSTKTKNQKLGRYILKLSTYLLFNHIVQYRINISTRDYFFNFLKFFGPNNFENLKNISEEDAKKIFNEFLFLYFKHYKYKFKD